MKQAFISNGKVEIFEVPVPKLDKNSILVKVFYSSISSGTELSGIASSKVPLYQKALKQPKKTLSAIKALDYDLAKITNFAKDKKEGLVYTGYSASGEVVAVGSKVKGIKEGDFVACGGAQFAFHAEYISVPVNLVVKIPNGLDLESASLTTIGAISLQGVRRLNPTLGEVVIVLGLGLIGLITSQILKANGCEVIGIDVDNRKINLAKKIGIQNVVQSEEGWTKKYLNSLVDGVIITASSNSDEIIADAFKVTRKKGRVVLVGDVGLKINRADIYEKEIDFFISSSYGPGRYDDNYELNGIDYPLPYVRWTENRNMQQFLSLLDKGLLDINSLITSKFDFEEVSDAFESFKTGNQVLVTLRYDFDVKGMNNKTKIDLLNKNQGPSNQGSSNNTKIGFIGPGNFASNTLLPALKKIGGFDFELLVGNNSGKLLQVGKKFNFSSISSNIKDIQENKLIQSVFISTRHSSHCDLIIESIQSNKNIFVEKPICLNFSELEKIEKAMKENQGNYSLTVGFNRRFAPAIQEIKSLISKSKTPLFINMNMNAGYIDQAHWVHGIDGGGRNIGEACHIYDLFIYLTGATFTEVSACSNQINEKYLLNENFTASIKFDDGSICTLNYTPMGNQGYPKESLTIFQGSSVYTLIDYKKLSIFYDQKREINKTFNSKGHQEELEEFLRFILDKRDPLFTWQEISQSARISFLVEEQLLT